MDDTLRKIIDFADQAHGNQMRKYTSERYIVHPVRVMNICRSYFNSLPVLSAALLHDVLEDTPTSRHEIHVFLQNIMSVDDARQTVEMVVELTDVYIKEAYPQWNRRKRKEKERQRLSMVSADAQTIKYADIIDNCKEIVKYDRQFGPKFINECRDLLKVMTAGDPQLYNVAKNTLLQGQF